MEKETRGGTTIWMWRGTGSWRWTGRRRWDNCMYKCVCVCVCVCARVRVPFQRRKAVGRRTLHQYPLSVSGQNWTRCRKWKREKTSINPSVQYLAYAVHIWPSEISLQGRCHGEGRAHGRGRCASPPHGKHTQRSLCVLPLACSSPRGAVESPPLASANRPVRPSVSRPKS